MTKFVYRDGDLVEVPDEDVVEITSPVFLPSLTPSALLMGLLHLNITPDMVDEAIATMPEPDRTIAKWRWERSQTFERDDWLINEMATAFGKTSEEVDDAWLYAATLR